MTLVDPHALPLTRPSLAGDQLTVPRGFTADALRVSFTVARTPSAVWDWLCDPSTFVDAQVWPYRVEFVDPVDGQPGGFTEGVLTNHHGPFLSLPSVLSEIREGEYRDLQYLYGSYVVSPRVARPTRLQFWVSDEAPRGTRVTLQVDAQVRTVLLGPWRRGNRWFWNRFGPWLEGAI